MTLKETTKRYKKHSECIQQTLITKEEAMNVYELLKELEALRKFAHYVAKSITAEEEEFDENPRFFGEVYCRKLHKLGIIKSVDNKWVYDEEASADERRI